MRLLLMHIDDPDGCGGLPALEEATLIVPGAEKVATLVPLQALAQVLPLMQEAMDGLAEQRCDACGEALAAVPDVDRAGL